MNLRTIGGVVTALMVTFAVSGCATIISGTTQKVNVTSDPTGALAKVDGNMSGVTPTVFTLERKQDHTVEISKEGYRTVTVILHHTVNGATAGNIIAGGVIGLGVDAMSGAMYKLIPDRVDARLEREAVSSQSSSTPVTEPIVEQNEIQKVAATEPVVSQEQVIPPATKMNFGPKK